MFTLLSFSAALVCLLALVNGVVGHGYVATVTIGGKSYPGWDPNIDPYAEPIPKRVIRKIPDDGPVLDINDASLACNVGGDAPAGLVAEASAGSTVTFTMIRWPADHLGPVSHYMASCNGDCLTFDTKNAKWFKLDAAGLSANGTWASTELIDNGLSASTVIPTELESGEYLIRHEIIALHDAGAPQFYPACAQVKVTGGGNQSPASADLVSIPGVYDNVVFPDIWDPSFHTFTVPGPAVAFSSSGATDNAGSSPPASSSASSSAHTTDTPSTSSAHASTTKNTQAPTATHSASSVHITASSSQVPASSATGRCRSSRKAKRHAEANSKRHVRHHARDKRHH